MRRDCQPLFRWGSPQPLRTTGFIPTDRPGYHGFMVTRGQLLERPVIVPAGPICLDGIYLRGGGPGLLIASPLPAFGGSMANPVGSELSYAAAYVGSASLRLDYRGVGASEGEPSPDLADAVFDLRQGLEFLQESCRAEFLAVAGYGSGCWSALALAASEPRIDRVVLVAPERGGEPEGLPAYDAVDAPVLIVLPGDDPGMNLGVETELADKATNARIEVIKGATRTFREALAKLHHLIPPFLGKQQRE